MRPVDWRDGSLRFIDQTKLPLELSYIETDSVEVLADAIRSLRIRGAPALGIAAAFGIVLGANASHGSDRKEFIRRIEEVSETIGSTRPTAVNLFWALRRMRAVYENAQAPDVEELKKLLLSEALAIQREDIAACLSIGKFGRELIRDGDGVLTHCNAGALATGDHGTALSVIVQAHESGKNILVFVDETRPLLQGARLTAWELQQAGIDVVLITDSTAAFVMQQGKIRIAVVGADRIAANGDVANKIGTYNVAVLAEKHNIPFYVAAPLSTIDRSLATGGDIPIEERDPREVTEPFGRRIAPVGVRVYSPAFDVTPHQLVKGIITECGILRPPFTTAIAAAFGTTAARMENV